MSEQRTNRIAVVIAAVFLALALLVVLPGCGDNSSDGGDNGGESKGTAIAGLDIARSALETMAPDAKLLVVQTGEAVTPTGTPVWAYLFGSPETGSTYAVYVSDGNVMGASEYGTAGLQEDEWGNVPGTDDLQVDSDEAYQAALELSGADGEPAAYFMGLQTYVPESMATTPSVSAFTWYVSFDPGESGASTGTIAVDAKSGEAEIIE